MKTDVTINQIWWNKGLMNFFFRSQAEKALSDLIYKTECPQFVLDEIDNFCEVNDLSVDDVEEIFYNDSEAEIIEEFGLQDYFTKEEDRED